MAELVDLDHGHYVSGAGGHLAAFVERLREVTRGSAFWDPAL